MKTFGHIDFQQNEIQQAVMKVEANFPSYPKVGQLTFKDKVLYICAEVQEGVPVWIPLTNEIGTYIHYQNFQSNTWTINHKLNTGAPMVQIYEADNRMVIPQNITIKSNTQVVVEFGFPVTGRAVILTGPEEGNEREQSAFEHFQTDLGDTWEIAHGLGYAPFTRIFIGDAEVLPASITHPDLFTVVVTFSEPQIGIARLA